MQASTKDESGQPPAATAQVASPSAKAERRRGLKQGAVQLQLLRQRWPAAFPADPRLVRPLASTTARTIAESLDWTPAYTRGVLTSWKNSTAYCRALLRYEERLHLDGAVSGERVDATAREQAQATLALKAARKARLLEEAHTSGQGSGVRVQPSKSYSSKTISASA